MNYESMLKDIREATDLRVLLNSQLQKQANIESQIAENKKEIDRRKSLEQANEKLVTDLEDLSKEVTKLQAELGKRLTNLEKNNIALPFDESPKPFVHS